MTVCSKFNGREMIEICLGCSSYVVFSKVLGGFRKIFRRFFNKFRKGLLRDLRESSRGRLREAQENLANPRNPSECWRILNPSES